MSLRLGGRSQNRPQSRLSLCDRANRKGQRASLRNPFFAQALKLRAVRGRFSRSIPTCTAFKITVPTPFSACERAHACPSKTGPASGGVVCIVHTCGVDVLGALHHPLRGWPRGAGPIYTGAFLDIGYSGTHEKTPLAGDGQRARRHWPFLVPDSHVGIVVRRLFRFPLEPA